MSDDERLRAIRGGHRGVVTKLIKEVDELLATGETFTAEQRTLLQVKQQQLDSKLKVLDDIDKQILDKCETSQIEQEITEAEVVSAKILACKQRILEAIKRPNEILPPSASLSVGSPPVLNKPKLPKLTLPRFRGDLTSWTTFWDLFQSTVHSNAGMSKIDKFSYLKSLLEGAAARTIQGLTLSDANYDAAITLLEERFGRSKEIIAAHMDELLKIPGCTVDRPSALRSVYDKIIVHVRGLETLEVTSDQYGSILTPVIMSKFPPDVRLRIARESEGKVWNIGNVLKIIKQEVEAREASENTHVNPPKSTNQSGRPPSSHNSTGSSLVINGSNVSCVYCHHNHFSASCTKVVELNERRDILKRSGRCFNCLRSNHKSKDCDSSKNCRYCHRRHHQSICEQCPTIKREPVTSDRGIPSRQNADQQVSVSNFASQVDGKRIVLLQTAHVEAIGDQAAVPVRVLLDNGSQLSYITTSVKTRLNLKPIRQERLSLNTFGSNSFTTRGCDVVRLALQKPGHSERLEITARTSPVICSNLPVLVNASKYIHLQGLDLADSSSNHQGGIDVLIGSDYYWQIVTGDVVSGESGPVAMNSIFGWLVSGPINDSSVVNSKYSSNLAIIGDQHTVNMHNDQLTGMLRQFWDTETIGIRDVPEGEKSTTFIPDINFDGARYEVKLPWKEECSGDNVPTHFNLCFNRLKYLQQKLLKKPSILKEYSKIIKEQQDRGIIEAIPNPTSGERNCETHSPVHYLPHHAVIRHDKETTKIRIVYDGSAKSTDDPLSLNDCLQTGPNLIPKLFDILLKFRWNPIAITADIEKAFLMISIHPSDRETIRFLWLDDPANLNSELIHFRFTRLVFGLRPSPAILGSVISHHLSKYRQQYPDVVGTIESSLYVDDLIAGAANVQDAYNLYVEAKSIMAEGNFNLRKWNSNSPLLVDQIRKAEQHPEIVPKKATDLKIDESCAKVFATSDNSCIESGLTKLLGIIWNSEEDVFVFCSTELVTFVQQLPATKRSLLKTSAKIFDPLGFLSPFVIKLKILFQVLCVEGSDWDEPLKDNALDQWNQFTNEFAMLDKVRIPRCYFLYDSDPVHVQIHGFSDASEHAFAAVVYIRSKYSDGRVITRLIASKTRVAPVKRQSIPRLELLGALILARLTETILTSLGKDIEAVYWSDSMPALCWIRNERPWKQYVARRVSEIRCLTSKQNWRHCPGPLNPADMPSRGLNGQKLLQSTSWWEGPAFLQPADSWPDDNTAEDDIVCKELAKNPPQPTHALAVPSTAVPQLEEVIDCNRFGNFNRLIRVTAYVYRFVNSLRKRGASHHSTVQLCPDELCKAETYWVSHVQSQKFPKELQYLEKRGGQAAPAYVKQFGTYLDDSHLIRCRGRINNANIAFTQKNPILLPAKHRFVDLLIKNFHERVKHNGVNDTLVALRENYWIICGRQAVKRIVRACVICKKFEGSPYSTPVSPDLPTCRVSADPPFTHVGLDFAGPLYIKAGRTSAEESTQKVYICLFTCASTRAIHLELTEGLNAETFLLAFRRFSSRRGLPATLVSDNARTFKSASKEIRSITRSREVFCYLTNQRTA